jgi:hypothetical protein
MKKDYTSRQRKIYSDYSSYSDEKLSYIIENENNYLSEVVNVAQDIINERREKINPSLTADQIKVIETLESAGAAFKKQKSGVSISKIINGILLLMCSLFGILGLLSDDLFAGGSLLSIPESYIKLALFLGSPTLGYFGISNLISGFSDIEEYPIAAKTAEATCNQFYKNLLGYNVTENGKPYLAYVCLSTQAKEEYGSYENFVIFWMEGSKRIKGVLNEVELDSTIIQSEQEFQIKMKFLANTYIFRYHAKPNLIQYGERWYFDIPKENSIPIYIED